MRAVLALIAALAAAPAAAQDEASRWFGQVDKTEAFLTFGVPESDEIEASLSCTRKTGQIRILFPVQHRMAETLRGGTTWVDNLGRPAPWPVSVTVGSATQQTTVRGSANVDELGGGSTITVELSERAPVMQEFATTGQLRLIATGETVAHAPAPRREASRFVRACR